MAANSRVRVSVAGNDLHRQVDEAWAALVAANDPQWPRVLVLGGALVRVERKTKEFHELGVASLTEELTRVADFGVWETANGEDVWKPRVPSERLVKILLDRGLNDLPDAPEVTGIIRVPTFLRDATAECGYRLVKTPGYDAPSKLVYLPDAGLETVSVPDELVDITDVDWARNLICTELLGDFDFKDQASLAHAVALGAQEFMRDFIEGNTPLYAVLAPTAGSGKGTLVDVILSVVMGDSVDLTPGTLRDEAEWRKNITSQLITGTRAIVFDNVAGAMNTSTLAMALTSGTWVDRLLGANKVVRLHPTNIWAATGNNLEFSEENARRLVAILLDPGEKIRASDRPKKEFRHSDISGWARQHRADLVCAYLTLVKHWLDGVWHWDLRTDDFIRVGPPIVETTVSLGSFDDWAKKMGGFLRANGIDGFLENRERVIAETDVESRETAELLEAWHGLGKEPLLYREVRELCEFGGQPLHDYLPSSARTALGKGTFDKWLRDHNNQRFGDYKLVSVPDSKPAKWYVTVPGRKPAGN